MDGRTDGRIELDLIFPAGGGGVVGRVHLQKSGEEKKMSMTEQKSFVHLLKDGNFFKKMFDEGFCLLPKGVELYVRRIFCLLWNGSNFFFPLFSF